MVNTSRCSLWLRPIAARAYIVGTAESDRRAYIFAKKHASAVGVRNKYSKRWDLTSVLASIVDLFPLHYCGARPDI
jgi:hypothetical protein